VSESTPSNSLDRYRNLAERALAGEAPSEAEAIWILEGDDVELLPLLQAAYEPRRAAFGRKVMVHVLNNVQNGLCPEDCGYCSQNKDSAAAIRKYAMKSDEAIMAEAEAAAKADRAKLWKVTQPVWKTKCGPTGASTGSIV